MSKLDLRVASHCCTEATLHKVQCQLRVEALNCSLHAASSSAGLSCWDLHQPLPLGSSGPHPQRCQLLALQTDCAGCPSQWHTLRPGYLDAVPVHCTDPFQVLDRAAAQGSCTDMVLTLGRIHDTNMISPCIGTVCRNRSWLHGSRCGRLSVCVV